MDDKKKLKQDNVLLETQALKKRLELELRSKRLRKVNSFPNIESEMSHSEKNPLDCAIHDINSAEISTTVKSRLPKFFNRLLRKQNKVNRYLISAFRNIVQHQHQIARVQEEKIKEDEAKLSDLKQSLSNLYSRFNALIESKGSKTISIKREGSLLEEIDFSQFYLSFENQFRGTQDEISEKLKVHIPIAIEARKRTPKEPFEAYDLGCGRGEWLSLLLQEGIVVKGIDSNLSLLRECRSKNLLVEEGDALSKLNDQADKSLSFISAFHLIEHLDFQAQFLFIRNAFRVLRPGGVLLYETPNVRNLDVGASGFFHDPTHIRPVPWTLGKFMAEYVGFLPVEIKFLNPDPSFENEDISGEFSSRLHGPRDYALIAYKE